MVIHNWCRRSTQCTQALRDRKIKICTVDSVPRLRDVWRSSIAGVRGELVEATLALPGRANSRGGGRGSENGCSGGVSMVGPSAAPFVRVPDVARALLQWANLGADPVLCLLWDRMTIMLKMPCRCVNVVHQSMHAATVRALSGRRLFVQYAVR
jgi:hypothetical protein